MAREAAQHLHVIGARAGWLLAQGTTAPFLIDSVMVGDDEVLVEHQFLAQPVAGGAGALGGVEGEQARLDFAEW